MKSLLNGENIAREPSGAMNLHYGFVFSVLSRPLSPSGFCGLDVQTGCGLYERREGLLSSMSAHSSTVSLLTPPSPAFCRISVIKAFCSTHAQQSPATVPQPPRRLASITVYPEHTHTTGGEQHLAPADPSTPSTAWQTSWCLSSPGFKALTWSLSV